MEEKSWLPADPAKLKANWDELEDSCGIESTVLEDEQTEILVAVLSEIKPEHYAGKRPPERSYEQGTGGIELFPFRWESNFFGRRPIYFKFAIATRDRKTRAFIYSIHPNRERD